MNVTRKSLHKFEVKDDSYISGYASVFDVRDAHNDIITRGAINARPQTKLLWQHDSRKPIGLCEYMALDDYGLFIRAKLCQEINLGIEVMQLIKATIIDSFSIGFFIRSYERDEDSGARIITEIDLLEVSLVTFPANELAKIII